MYILLLLLFSYKSHFDVYYNSISGIVMLKMSYFKPDFTISRPFVYYIVRNISDKKGNDNILPIFSGYVEEP